MWSLDLLREWVCRNSAAFGLVARHLPICKNVSRYQLTRATKSVDNLLAPASADMFKLQLNKLCTGVQWIWDRGS